MSEIRVALVEDHQPTREGLAALIGSGPDYRVTGTFGSMEDALAHLEDDPPDVLLLDLHLPGMSGIDGLRLLRARFPILQVVVLTVFADDTHVFDAICAGACGYLLKETPPDKLLDFIHDAHRGGVPMSREIARKVLLLFQKVAPPKVEEANLSPRELAIVRLLAAGHSYKTAAVELALSIDTVRFHVRNIYVRLHVHSKSEAVLKAQRQGLLV